MGDQDSIIGKEEVTYQLLKSLCVRLESPEIEQTAVKAVADVSSLGSSRFSVACLSIMLKKMLKSGVFAQSGVEVAKDYYLVGRGALNEAAEL